MKNKAKSNKDIIIVSSGILCIITIFLLVYLIPRHKVDQDKKVISKQDIEVKNHVTSNIEEKEEEKEPYLVSYEDLVNAGSIHSDDIKDIDISPYSFDSETDSFKNNSDQEDEDSTKTQKDKIKNQDSVEKSDVKDEKVIVIDESSETMKDETIEYEYKGEKSSSKEIDIFGAEPKEEGKSVDGDISAGGEQNVGTWN